MDCASAGLGGQVVACVALGGLYCVVGAITAPSSELLALRPKMLVCLSTLVGVWFAVWPNGALTLRAASLSSSAQCGLQLARTRFERAGGRELCHSLHSIQLPHHTAQLHAAAASSNVARRT